MAETRRVTDAHQAVYGAVCYADALDRAAGIDNLHEWVVGRAMTEVEVAMAIDELAAAGRIEVHGNRAAVAGRSALAGPVEQGKANAGRFDGPERAVAQTWSLAQRWARRLGRVPMVRMVAVTGALARLDAFTTGSTGGTRDQPVIEYALVVRPRRLWLTRALAEAVRKRARTQGVDFEISMVTTTRSMELPGPSLHMAGELAAMKPVVGGAVMRTMRRSNQWMFQFFPNATAEGDESWLDELDWPLLLTWARKLAERVLLSPLTKPLERWFRRLTVSRLGESTRAATTTGRRSELLGPDACLFPLAVDASRIDAVWTIRMNELR